MWGSNACDRNPTRAERMQCVMHACKGVRGAGAGAALMSPAEGRQGVNSAAFALLPAGTGIHDGLHHARAQHVPPPGPPAANTVHHTSASGRVQRQGAFTASDGATPQACTEIGGRAMFAAPVACRALGAEGAAHRVESGSPADWLPLLVSEATEGDEAGEPAALAFSAAAAAPAARRRLNANSPATAAPA